MLTDPEPAEARRPRRRWRRKAQRQTKQSAGDAAAADALRCAANEVLLGRAAIEACGSRWDPSAAL